MYRGTTPTIEYTLDTDVDLTMITEVYFTVAQTQVSSISVTKYFSENEVIVDAEEKTITTMLTQEDTLKFNSGFVSVQLRVLLSNDKCYVTDITTVPMEKILKGGVINVNRSDED